MRAQAFWPGRQRAGGDAPPLEQILPAIKALRSVGHIVEHRAWFTLPDQGPLEALAERLRGIEIPELAGATSFRVTTVRVGDHDFSTIDVQRAAGAVLLERSAVPVDLRSFDLNIRVDVIESLCLVGIQLTDERMDKRHEKIYQPRVTLRPTVAFAMLTLCGLRPERGRVLDPFCGSGNILLEAGDVLPGFELHGSDYNPRAIEGAAENLRAAGLEARSTLRCLDARELAGVYEPGSIDAIVTDPPYGVRMGRNVNFHGLYIRFLEAAWTVLVPRGRLVILVGKQRAAFNRVVRQFGDSACCTRASSRPAASIPPCSSWSASSGRERPARRAPVAARRARWLSSS